MKTHSCQRPLRNPISRISVVNALVVVLGSVFIFQQFAGEHFLSLVALTPHKVWKNHSLWQVGSYLFFHGTIFHLLCTIGALYLFGRSLENRWGSRFFFKYFFLCGMSAGLCIAFLTPAARVATIGASGAVFGLLAGYAVYFRGQTIRLAGRFPVKARYLLLLYGMVAFYYSADYPGLGAAHFAPLAGLAAGFLYLNHYSLKFLIMKRVHEHRAQQARKRYQVIEGGKLHRQSQQFERGQGR